jgi:hypothetical protein
VKKTILTATLVMLAVSVSVQAQNQTRPALTTADIQRLQDNVFEASADLSTLRDRDPRRAESLRSELDDLRDEVIYLKVKMRKESGVTRAEYADLRDRIERFRSDARGERAQAPAPAVARPSATPNDDRRPNDVRPASDDRRVNDDRRVSATEIPVGTEFDVRLQTRLNSGTARVEDRFDATTVVPYEHNGRVLVPSGSVLRGTVSSVTPASRGVNRRGELTLIFDRFTIEGRTYTARATVMQALQGETDTGRVAAGAGVGAIIGGILGGVRGALTGILIGGGGTVAATEGNEVDLAPGTLLRVRLDAPIDVAR